MSKLQTKFKFTKEDVKGLRDSAGLTQQKASESILLKSSSSWRDWESGRSPMGKATVEYFCLKNNLCFESVLKESGNAL
jgi:DNA-binding transcriptional regulator YiaG